MSSNFLIFNQGQANQETDSQYAADALRTLGAQSGSILPSPLFNKLEYQSSIFVSAFAQMMANKGYTVVDSNYANLVAVLTNVKTTADFEDSIITVPFASSVVFNAAQAAAFDLSLTGNVTSSSLVNFTQGQVITFIITQDATGNRTFAWPSGISTYAVCPQANTTTVQSFIVRTNNAIVPYGPMLWIMPSGLIVQPAGGSLVIPINASGNVFNQVANLTEKVSTAGGPITRNLYTAVGYNGFTVTVKKFDQTVNAITVQPLVAGQTIDGFPNFTISKPYNAITFQADGANWIII